MRLGIAEHTGIKDVGAHSQLLRRFHGDGHLIAGHHLDLHAHLHGAGDSCFGIGARRVEQW